MNFEEIEQLIDNDIPVYKKKTKKTLKKTPKSKNKYLSDDDDLL